MSITVKAAGSTFTFYDFNKEAGNVHFITDTPNSDTKPLVDWLFVFSHDEMRELIAAFSSLLPPSTREPLYAVVEYYSDSDEEGSVISSFHGTEGEAVEAAAKKSAKSGDEVTVYKRVASVRATKIETYKTEVER